MGLGLFGGSSCTPERVVYVYDPGSNGNPNPRKFVIEKTYQVGRNLVAVVTYPDALNYEGRKVMVYRDLKKRKFLGLEYIDPHFCDHAEHEAPFARFEPTQKGVEAAIFLAERI